MIRTITTLVAAAGLALTIGAGSALAKAHSAGVAEGGTPGEQDSARDTIDALTGDDLPLDGRGVSAITKNGQQGTASSGAGGGNRTNPTVGNGKNSE